ncbi:MAG: DUF1800 family protein [Cyanobacteria bacterium REEB67]|nr:DUF1800 family protein [Cyanobacteria bacterium REEB67]
MQMAKRRRRDRRIVAALSLLVLGAVALVETLGGPGSSQRAWAEAGGPQRLRRAGQATASGDARPLSAAADESQAVNNSLVATADQRVVHLLNRITFGARPGDVEAVERQGLRNYLSAQLNPASIAEAPEVVQKLQNTAALNQPSAVLINRYREVAKERKLRKQQEAGANGSATSGASVGPGGDLPQNALKAGGKAGAADGAKKQVGQQLISARLMRAVDSNRQLQEVMTDFWYNHFNISIDKGLDRALVGAFEEQAIRPYALGRFRDLLGATCYHPAMLFYLDNWQNVKAGATSRQGKVSGINENYARELMELHTLGVDGGYTQKDVQEMARVLTGLGLPNPRRQTGDGKWGSFNANYHDFGDKTVLGHRIAGVGAAEIDQALDLLARQPATAHHIAYQLAQYFVADDPPKALVDKLAAKFSESDGNIKTVMSTLFDSPEFWDGRYQNNKYKSPFRYAVSVFRATSTEPSDYQAVAQFLRLQGQPVYGCLTPDGYKNTQSAWLNPDALMNRINFATTVGSGRARFLSAPPVAFAQARDTVCGGKLSGHTEAVIAKAPPALKLSLLIGSPEFMHY